MIWTWIKSVGEFLAVISTATGIIYGVIAFDKERGDRERERISRAWSLVSDTKVPGQGNLGLNEALQILNHRGIDLGRVHLPKTYLSKVNLSRAILDSADLQEANLEHAMLCGASLSQALLRRANLSAADARGAVLDGADLAVANLRNTDFSPLPSPDDTPDRLVAANFRGANLQDADLSGANLAWADLRAARLTGATLFRANLYGANLELADVRDANLGAADLTEARLGGAILSRANLRGARLSGSKLHASQLDGAKLVRADFSGARGVPDDDNLDLTEACFDKTATFGESEQVRATLPGERLCGPPSRAASSADPRPQSPNANGGSRPCVP
jgi:uncharacterized protein YjbI with pentapeptide repeats